jgi:CubicO group peptidase (beta-lactamase class C family)
MGWVKELARAMASAAALSLSVTAGAHAHQQAQGALEPPTDGEIAASPAVKRLKELLEVVNSGDAAAMKAYIAANGVDVMRLQPGSGVNPLVSGTELPLVGRVLDLYRRSHGLIFVRVSRVEKNGAIAIVRDKLTGYEQALSVAVEPEAPHRITGMPKVPFAILISLARPPAVSSEEARLQQIGSYLERLADVDAFSGVVVISRAGKPVFSEAYGFADRERKIPNALSTPFLVGSVSKLFTGLAIGQLVEQGKLSYDDPLSKFLPDFPDPESARRIKIKHLLSHTAGLGDYTASKAHQDSLNRMITVRALLDVADREPLKFEPGTGWAYSNTGFAVLGRVIEIVSGEDYYDHMERHIFAPAGMKSASFPILPQSGISTTPMALPYEVEYNGQHLYHANKLGIHHRRGGPTGNGVISALDFMKAANAFRAGQIVRPETFRVHSSQKPELGANNYGYGFAKMEFGLIGHSGGTWGVCSRFGELSDTPYTLVVLSNVNMNDCIYVSVNIQRLLAPNKSP